MMIEDCFILTKDDRKQIRRNFAEALIAKMEGADSSLKCLPSFLPRPSGQESGTYLALDFGGSNVRAMTVKLADGEADILRMKKMSLRRVGSLDYTSADVQAKDLFGVIADLILTVTAGGETVALGPTFSFPAEQLTVGEARLIKWTKEFAVKGVVGENVNQLLSDAFTRRGIDSIRPVAIINDTVGTLLASAYHRPNTTIGSICGTGHNTAAVLPDGMIYNLESGNFDGLPVTEYDLALDQMSLAPNEQRLEKMSAGHYLGKIVTLAAADKLDCLGTGAELTGEDLGLILNDGGQSHRTADLIERRFGARLTQSDCAFLRRLTRAVVARSAQMVACTYLGILDVIDPSHTEHHTIAVDGSLFGKMPMYAKEVERALAEGLADVEATADLVWAGDGSGIGAAVAAALAIAHRGERREYRTFAESMVALYGSKGEA